MHGRHRVRLPVARDRSGCLSGLAADVVYKFLGRGAGYFEGGNAAACYVDGNGHGVQDRGGLRPVRGGYGGCCLWCCEEGLRSWLGLVLAAFDGVCPGGRFARFGDRCPILVGRQLRPAGLLNVFGQGRWGAQAVYPRAIQLCEGKIRRWN